MLLWYLINQWIFYDLLNSGWMWFAWLVMSLQRSISMHALALLGATKWTLDLREIAHSNGCSRDLSRFAHGGHSGAQCWSCCRPSPGRGYKSHWSQRTAACNESGIQKVKVRWWDDMRRNDMELLYFSPVLRGHMTWPVRAQHAHSKLVVHDAARGMITFDRIKWELSHLSMAQQPCRFSSTLRCNQCLRKGEAMAIGFATLLHFEGVYQPQH